MLKKYGKEIAILLIQLLMFYGCPQFAGAANGMGLVLLLILATFVLSVVMGRVSTKRVKWVYPAVLAALFIPSVFIYYNESALIHSLWYLTVSAVGLAMGSVIGGIRRVDKR